MINNDTLIHLFKQLKGRKSEVSFSRLFNYCFPDIMRFTFSFIKSKSIAEEIASDVLLSVWKKREEIQPTEDFKLYLYVSARNKAYNYLRKKHNQPTISLEDSAIWTKAAHSPTPEDTLITTELRTKITEAIHQLPPKCRLIYKLVKEDGLKYKEAATLLNLSPKTIEAQMGIAMKRLFKVFHNYLQEPSSPLLLSKETK